MGKRRTPEQKRKVYETLANCIIGNHAMFRDMPEERKMAINGIRNQIFDCPSTNSGLVSEKGQHLKKVNLVKEHFYPRQASAHKTFEMLDAGATKDEIVDFIAMVCQVHHVTKEENETLKRYQKIGSGYHTWEEQYAAAGITLVPYERKKPGRRKK